MCNVAHNCKSAKQLPDDDKELLEKPYAATTTAAMPATTYCSQSAYSCDWYTAVIASAPKRTFAANFRAGDACAMSSNTVYQVTTDTSFL